MNVYQLSSPKITGHIELHYVDGVLNAILFEIKQPLNDRQFNTLLQVIRQEENSVELMAGEGLNVARIMPTNAKITMFCAAYLKYKNVKYQVSRSDSGKIKLIKIDEGILDNYFTSENFLFKGKQSISNLVRYYNELLAEIAAGAKSKHPDYWSTAYGTKVAGTPDYKDYIDHLHKLGFRPKKDSMGNVKEWIKA